MNGRKYSAGSRHRSLEGKAHCFIRHIHCIHIFIIYRSFEMITETFIKRFTLADVYAHILLWSYSLESAIVFKAVTQTLPFLPRWQMYMMPRCYQVTHPKH